MNAIRYDALFFKFATKFIDLKELFSTQTVITADVLFHLEKLSTPMKANISFVSGLT